MIYKTLPLILLSFLVFGFTNIKENINLVNTTDPKILAEGTKGATTLEAKCKSLYETIQVGKYSLPNYESFTKAFEGFEQLKFQGKIENEFLTIIDFSLSSTQERMWVIDMQSKMVVLQTLVAHGKNSGEEFANKFSNISESFQSSLGFYITGETYSGKHGLSLRLDGVEYGINDKARDRAVVIHGADYVSNSFAQKHGRLGRSQGCPAVAKEINEKLINTIKDKSCLFIYHPSRSYVIKSKLVS
jgi:hypothetical protein